jgi:hypothetical protein
MVASPAALRVVVLEVGVTGVGGQLQPPGEVVHRTAVEPRIKTRLPSLNLQLSHRHQQCLFDRPGTGHAAAGSPAWPLCC